MTNGVTKGVRVKEKKYVANSTSFKKGCKGGPGPKKLTERQRENKKLMLEHINDLAELLYTQDRASVLKKIENQHSSSLLELFVANSIKKHDSRFIEMIINRTVGKVKENVYIKSEIKNTAKDLTTEQLEKIDKIINDSSE